MNSMDLIWTNLIQSGPFTGCWEMVDKNTGNSHYMKIIDFIKLESNKKFDYFSKEISMLSLISKKNIPHIPKLVSFFKDSTSYYVIFEKPKYTSLCERISKSGTFTEKEARNFTSSFLKIISLLGDSLIADFLPLTISPETIFLKDDGSIGQLYIHHQNSQIVNLSELATTRTTAPETITLSKFSSKCFSWFLGVVLYFVLCGRFPFEGETVKETNLNILRFHPTFPSNISIHCCDFISALLCKNPQMRPSIEKVAEVQFTKTDLMMKRKSSGDEMTFQRQLFQSTEKNSLLYLKGDPKASSMTSLEFPHAKRLGLKNQMQSGIDWKVISTKRMSITPKKSMSPIKPNVFLRIF